MPVPFGARQPGSPGRAPSLPPKFAGDYEIFAGGQQYNPQQYFSPGVTSYTIVLKIAYENWDQAGDTPGGTTIRLQFSPGTPQKDIVAALLGTIEQRLSNLDEFGRTRSYDSTQSGTLGTPTL